MLSSGGSSDVKSPKAGDDRKNRWLQSLDHDKPVNSAYFSPLDGTRLLTTDQVTTYLLVPFKKGKDVNIVYGLW